MESFIIGFYAVFKILIAQGIEYDVNNNLIKPNAIKFIFAPFFIFHFGIFTICHGVFLWMLFSWKDGSFEIFKNVDLLLLNIGFFIVSHGVSFGYNYIWKKEYKKISPGDAMLAPYSRIVVMHLCLMFSFFIFGVFGFGLLVSILVVFIKIILDYGLHNKQHLIFSSDYKN